MAMYRYVKAPPRGQRSYVRFRIGRHRYGPYPFLLMSLGMAIIAWTFWPVISFSLYTGPLLSTVVSPISGGGIATVVEAGNGQVRKDVSTNANTWYPTKPQKKVVAPVNAYTLSIPKLRIQDATVIIGGDDLDKSLIHYGGTGLPGDYGNAVIFGHSTLPQFYNPKDYKTIFSTLPTLKIGDEIIVKYDGISYRYVIYNMTVTDPADLSPLEQQFDDSYITLITCVPPGTTWKRLNVRARLVKFAP